MERIISNQAAAYAAEKYQAALPLLRESASSISDYVEKLDGDERILMEFLYGTMPFCDAGDYEPELIHAYVKHGLFLRREKEWTKSLPEDVFFNYVLYYRVNNEDITDCRSWFYEKLWPLVEGRSEEEAVKEVNYWCAKEATYTASDGRTLGPVGVYKSGSGRCGEESTFLVTVLRSIGIAARQVYTPRWAHCDDNHAWVEAWVDGKWRFLGACEPEEILDRGWFTNASSRAMMIHTRVFSDYESGENGRCEQITERSGAALFYNDTDTYARTSELTVKVQDDQGNPVPDAKVEFEILNMAEFSPISTLYTDVEGKVQLMMGLGTIQVHVSKGVYCCERMVHNGESSEETFVLEAQQWREQLEKVGEEWQLVDHVAPRDYPMHPVRPTEEQKEIGRARKKAADELRRKKLLSYYNEEAAEKYQNLKTILRLSYGNVDEILTFLEAHGEKDAASLLQVLAEKDYRDITAELLTEHFTYAGKVKSFCCDTYLQGEENAQELFEKYVLNPRVRYEAITPYRSFLTERLSQEQKARFRETPEEIWSWVEQTAGCEKSKNYQSVVASPIGVVRSGQASETAKKTLFVAVCRTLGIPARINTVNGKTEYYRNGSFVEAKSNTPCTQEIRDAQENESRGVRLVLTSEDAPVYYADWTIGRLTTVREPGETGRSFTGFETLDFYGEEFENGVMTLELPQGIYRVITTTRLPNGNQMEARRIVDTKTFTLGPDGTPESTLSLMMREPKTEDMLEELKLEEFTLRDEAGSRHSFEELLGEQHMMLAFLEEGMEPTEHLLLELLEQEKEVKDSGLKLMFVVAHRESLQNATLAKVCRQLPVTICYDDFTELPEQLARRMYTDPEKLPLVLLVSPGMRGRYACSGYNVGSVGLMLRIAKMLEK